MTRFVIITVFEVDGFVVTFPPTLFVAFVILSQDFCEIDMDMMYDELWHPVQYPDLAGVFCEHFLLLCRHVGSYGIGFSRIFRTSHESVVHLSFS